MQGTDTKAGRNQFRCYHCRTIVLKKDGDWFHWDQMQVHLCRPCQKTTEKRPERSDEKA